MIQRVQSVFLLLAAVCLVLGTFLPAFNGELSEASLRVTSMFRSTSGPELAMEITNGVWGFVFAGLLVIGTLVSLGTIMLFNNRPMQLKLARLAVLISAISLAAGFYVIDLVKGDFPQLSNGKFGPALFMPILGIIFLFLASRYIRKDEELVRASDRLR